MIEGLQPLHWGMQAATPAPSTPAGPNEAQLQKDSTKLSFRFKRFMAEEMVEATTKFRTVDKIQNAVIGLFAKPKKDAIPPNMDSLVPGLYRGAQPNQQGFQYLAHIGVKTVINLTDETNFDAKMATAAGLKVIYQPQDGFAAPSDTQTRAFLRAATNPANGPVYFHCYHGSDRTGTMAASYRIAVQGWSADQAIAELGPHGFNTPFEQAKLAYIKDFAAKWRGNAAGFLAAGP